MTIKKNAVAGDYMFGCQDDKTLISMITKKKKAVVVLSTMHDTDTVNDVTQKPTQIMDYNSTKGGVDTVDLMCSRISTSRRTQRWPVTIFFRLLDLAGINSLRIFQWNTAHVKVIRRRIYIKQLALDLMSENLKQRAQLKHLPRDLTVFLETYKEGQESSSSSNQFVHQPTQSGEVYAISVDQGRTIEPDWNAKFVEKMCANSTQIFLLRAICVTKLKAKTVIWM